MPNRSKRSRAKDSRAATLASNAPHKQLNHALQARNLGLTSETPRLRKVTVGIVTYNQTDLEIRQLVATARQALTSQFCDKQSNILILDNGQATTNITGLGDRVSHLPSRGNIGFGAGQNALMNEALENHADLYIAANPDGRFHPDAIEELIRMLAAHEDRALIEAMQFPDEHPKEFNPETFDTPWVSGACLAVPRVVYENIGGFDDAFFMYCEDVDFSWRARAAGFATKVCPRSLFYHSVTNRPYNRARHQQFLSSGLVLARKWRNSGFENIILRELKAGSFQVPECSVAPVPEEWTRVCDFGHRFSFAATRW
jgi:GT2 family glycosyltransferase